MFRIDYEIWFYVQKRKKCSWEWLTVLFLHFNDDGFDVFWSMVAVNVAKCNLERENCRSINRNVRHHHSPLSRDSKFDRRDEDSPSLSEANQRQLDPSAASTSCFRHWVATFPPFLADHIAPIAFCNESSIIRDPPPRFHSLPPQRRDFLIERVLLGQFREMGSVLRFDVGFQFLDLVVFRCNFSLQVRFVAFHSLQTKLKLGRLFPLRC